MSACFATGLSLVTLLSAKTASVTACRSGVSMGRAQSRNRMLSTYLYVNGDASLRHSTLHLLRRPSWCSIWSLLEWLTTTSLIYMYSRWWGNPIKD